MRKTCGRVTRTYSVSGNSARPNKTSTTAVSMNVRWAADPRAPDDACLGTQRFCDAVNLLGSPQLHMGREGLSSREVSSVVVENPLHYACELRPGMAGIARSVSEVAT